MNSRAAALSVVSDDLFEYPIPSSERLDSHSYFSFHHGWWKNSSFKVRADLEVKGAFLELISGCQNEAPVGTLPVDEDLLAFMVGVPLDRWRQLMERKINPLYGWQRCICDNGEHRLFHKTVLKVVQAASKTKTVDAERRASDRERKRLEELPAKIIRAGGSASMSQDTGYVLRLDQFLLDTVAEGRSRTIKVVRDAMERMDLAHG